MGKVIFFDLDGVLADFVGGSLALHGKTLHPAEVKWDFCTQVGFDGPGCPKFWGPLGNREFWAGLPVLADGGRLHDWLVQDLFDPDAARSAVPPKVGVLSSGLCPGSVDGKLDWLRRHYPALARGAVFTPHKHLCAAPGKLLIDDHDGNCDQFRAAGGAAVLVPRPWNARSAECDGEGRFNPAAVVAEVAAWAKA